MGSRRRLSGLLRTRFQFHAGGQLTAIPIPIAATPSSTTLPVHNDAPANGKSSANGSNSPENGSSVSPNEQGRKLLPATVLQMTIPAALVAQNRPPAPRPIRSGRHRSGGLFRWLRQHRRRRWIPRFQQLPGQGSIAAQTAPQAFLVWRAAPRRGGFGGAAASGGPIVGVTVPLKKASILSTARRRSTTNGSSSTIRRIELRLPLARVTAKWAWAGRPLLQERLSSGQNGTGSTFPRGLGYLDRTTVKSVEAVDSVRGAAAGSVREAAALDPLHPGRMAC